MSLDSDSDSYSEICISPQFAGGLDSPQFAGGLDSPQFSGGLDTPQNAHPLIQAHADSIPANATLSEKFSALQTVDSSYAATDTAAQLLQGQSAVPAWFTNALLQDLHGICVDHTATMAHNDAAANMASHFAACRIAAKDAAELSDYRDDLLDQTQAMLAEARAQTNMLTHEHMYRRLRLDIVADIHERYVVGSTAGDWRQNARREQHEIGDTYCKARLDSCRADARLIWLPYPDSISGDDARARFNDLTNRQTTVENAPPLTADDAAHMRFHALEKLLNNSFSHSLYAEMIDDVARARNEAAAAATMISDMCNMLVAARNKADFEQRRHDNAVMLNTSFFNELDVLFDNKSPENKNNTRAPWQHAARIDEVTVRLKYIHDQLTTTDTVSAPDEEAYRDLVLRVVDEASAAIAAAQADVAAAKKEAAETETRYRTVVRAGVEAKDALCKRQTDALGETIHRLRLEKATYESALAERATAGEMCRLKTDISNKLLGQKAVQLDETLRAVGTWHYAEQQLKTGGHSAEEDSLPKETPHLSLQEQLTEANNKIGFLNHQVIVLTRQNNELARKSAPEDVLRRTRDATRYQAEFDFSQKLDAIMQDHLLEVQDLRAIASSTRNAMGALVRAIPGITKTDNGHDPVAIPSVSELLYQRQAMHKDLSATYKARIDNLTSQLAMCEAEVKLLKPTADGTMVRIVPPSALSISCSTSAQLCRKLRELQDENSELHAQRASFETAALYDAPAPTSYREKKRLHDLRRRYEDKVARLQGAVDLLTQIVHRVESKQVDGLVGELLNLKTRLAEEEATCIKARASLIQATIDAETNKNRSLDLLKLARDRLTHVEMQMKDIISMSAAARDKLQECLLIAFCSLLSLSETIYNQNWTKEFAMAGFQDLGNKARQTLNAVMKDHAEIQKTIDEESSTLSKPQLYQTLVNKTLQLEHESKKAAHYQNMVQRIRADFAAHDVIGSDMRLLINEYIQPDFDDSIPACPDVEPMPAVLEKAENLASLYFSLRDEHKASHRAVVVSRSMLADAAAEAFRQRDVYKDMALVAQQNVAAQEKQLVEAYADENIQSHWPKLSEDSMQGPGHLGHESQTLNPQKQSISIMNDYKMGSRPRMRVLDDNDSLGDSESDDNINNDDSEYYHCPISSDSDHDSGSSHSSEDHNAVIEQTKAAILKKSTYTSVAALCKLHSLVEVLIAKTEILEYQLNISNAKVVAVGAQLKDALIRSRVYESKAVDFEVSSMRALYNLKKAKLYSNGYAYGDSLYLSDDDYDDSFGGMDEECAQLIKNYLNKGFLRIERDTEANTETLQNTIKGQQLAIDMLQIQLDKERAQSREDRAVYQKQQAQLLVLKERAYDVMNGSVAQEEQQSDSLTATLIEALDKSTSLALSLVKFKAVITRQLMRNGILEKVLDVSKLDPDVIRHRNSRDLHNCFKKNGRGCNTDTVCVFTQAELAYRAELKQYYTILGIISRAIKNRHYSRADMLLRRARKAMAGMAVYGPDSPFRDELYGQLLARQIESSVGGGNCSRVLPLYSRLLAHRPETCIDKKELYRLAKLSVVATKQRQG